MTDEQLIYIKQLRDEGISWTVLPEYFNKKFKTDLKDSSLRTAFRRSLYYVASPNNTNKKLKELKDKDFRERSNKMGIDTSKLDTRRILTISDQHMPYHHPDMFKFLAALKKKYKPTLVVNGGDEVDKHGLSFHDSHPDLLSPGDELKAAIKNMRQMEKMFPQMILLDSNHGSLAVRKLKHHGIPLKYLATPQQIYGVSDKWQWTDSLTLELPNGQEAFFCHGISKQGIKVASQRGINVVQFHYHTEFRIDYTGNPDNLLFSLQCGCLIDRKSLAFEYDKLNLNRPIIGTGLIIDSKPILQPMYLNKKGRWTGKL